MGFQDVAYLPSRARSTPHFLKIAVELKASGPSHILKLWLVTIKTMHTVKYFHPMKTMHTVKYFHLMKPLFVSVKFFQHHKNVTTLR